MKKYFLFAMLLHLTLSGVSSELRGQNESTSPPQDSTAQDSTASESNQDPAPSAGSLLGIDLDAISQFAKRNGARKYSKLSTEMVDLMSPLVTSVSGSTVRVYSGQKQLAIGTVVDSNGLILTIAGELKSDLECRLPDGTSKPAKVIGIDQDTGLAMLKVEASGLLPAHFTPTASPGVGGWIASASPDQHPVGIGVVSVAERKIVGGGAFLGIRPAPQSEGNAKGVMIIDVPYDAPADKAGIHVGDRIIRIAGTEMNDADSVYKKLQEFTPGDKIEVVVTRGNQELVFDIVLAPRDKFDSLRNEQDRMGSTLSRRRQGFQSAFQHDTFIQANECGSPVIDLDGKIVGINVSRSGRVSTLALPIPAVTQAIERMKTGQLAPEIINAKRIQQIDVELDKLISEMKPLSGKLDEGETELKKQDDRVQALKSIQADLEAKLAVMEQDAMAKKEDLKTIRTQLAEMKVKIKRLEDELEGLKSGANVR